MSKIIVVFASMSGNTEEMADAITAGIRQSGVEPVVKEVMDTNASELEVYDGILLGAYTWGDGELPDEFLDFYDEMDEISLEGRKIAVFGSADSSYPVFGAAVDILIEKLVERGGEKVLDGLKIELSPSADEKQECIQYGKRFVESLV
ncbi:flavodoxin [Paenibacillus sp. GCM10012307]|uniref:Flavodoxin n=1 Tax=Paenibacillus roseus TaxID=2798579 RepID=A0A934J2N5_9BACL|nr:flavodoxin [Paenibacillus roseus]MBJ6360469.1 flavodoxin [Paenibacillus roseus]